MAEEQRPVVEHAGRVYDAEMGEISGFGGGYEFACRKMVLAGMAWVDAHPEADLKFGGFKNIYGVLTDESPDAKALSDAMVAATDGDCTGAMHQAAVGHVMAYKRLGWDEYRKKMVERDDEAAAGA